MGLIKEKKVRLSTLVAIYNIILVLMDVPYVKQIFYLSDKEKIVLYVLGFCLELCICLLNRKITVGFLILIYIYFIFAFSTLWNGGNLQNYVIRLAPSFLITFFLICTKPQTHIKILLMWRKVLFVLLLLDLVTICLYPDGLYFTVNYTNNWLLGYKTERLVYTFPMLMMYAYLDTKINQKISVKTFIIGILVYIDTILSDGSMATFVVFLYLIILLFINLYFRNEKKQQKLGKILYSLANYKIAIIVYITMFIILVVFPETTVFKNTIAQLFGKSSTFSNRTFIWSFLLGKFINKPILGLGWLTGSEYLQITHVFGSTNAHNYVLSVLITGGIMALGGFIALNIYALGNKTRVYRNTDFVLIGCIYAFLIMGFSSSTMFYSGFVYLPYILMDDDKRFKPVKKEKEIRTVC